MIGWRRTFLCARCLDTYQTVAYTADDCNVVTLKLLRLDAFHKQFFASRRLVCQHVSKRRDKTVQLLRLVWVRVRVNFTVTTFHWMSNAIVEVRVEFVCSEIGTVTYCIFHLFHAPVHLARLHSQVNRITLYISTVQKTQRHAWPPLYNEGGPAADAIFLW